MLSGGWSSPSSLLGDTGKMVELGKVEKANKDGKAVWKRFSARFRPKMRLM